MLIQGRIDRFHAETGFAPAAITTGIARVLRLGSRGHTAIVDRVTVDVPLEC
jgi:uncharacterized protein YerC